jgi:hypothetical protein
VFMTTRRTTDAEMVVRGWVKTGRKSWEHISGATVSYDCMAWNWVVGGASKKHAGARYGTRWVAVMWVEKEAEESATVGAVIR